MSVINFMNYSLSTAAEGFMPSPAPLKNSTQYAESAVYDANGMPLTSYLTAVPAGTMNESSFECQDGTNQTVGQWP